MKMNKEEKKQKTNLFKSKEKSYLLIVNYLPQSLKENHLSQIFSSIGPLKSCQLIQNKQTGYSCGYAFIEYFNGEKDGQLACEKFNGLQIGDKTIQVSQCRPQSNETRHCKLYVKGFSNDINENEFNQLFSSFGQIIQIRILKDKSVAFILMSTHSEAQKAKDYLQGYQMNLNHFLQIEFAQQQKKHSETHHSTTIVDSNPIENDCIYVYGLSECVTQLELIQLFNQYGNVLRIQIIRDQNTGLSKGYAFIHMDQSDQAIQHLNQFYFHGKYLQVKLKQTNLHSNHSIHY